MLCVDEIVDLVRDSCRDLHALVVSYGKSILSTGFKHVFAKDNSLIIKLCRVHVIGSVGVYGLDGIPGERVSHNCGDVILAVAVLSVVAEVVQVGRHF